MRMQIDRDNLPGVLAALPASDTAAGAPSAEPGPASASPRQPASSSALDDLDRTVTAVLALDPGTVTDTGALETIEQLARQRRRLEAAWLQAIAVADQIDATSAAGIPATLQQHLSAGTGSSPGRAKADLEAARAVHWSVSNFRDGWFSCFLRRVG
ncbi:hypothetical protein [Arthrobacter castelli]|uniref:hypothetical protein n=1 Tax=Arthrobacter castelli TaxID=271431 RepID=UPI00040BC8A8|nr:hypothetical protein [Arthrobacter castelli]